MKKNNRKYFLCPEMLIISFKIRIAFSLIISVFMMLGCTSSSEVEYSWQKPQATVTETGAVLWKPEPFKDNVKGQQVRYIDYENGDDSNDGLSKNSPWKHHPWDYNASGKARESSGVKTYVFKRGVFYRGQLYARESGTAGQPIRLTSTANWGTGEAVFTGSVKLPGEWVPATDEKITAPERLAEPENVWALDLTALSWWNNGQPGYIANSAGNYEQNRRTVKLPFIGLFTVLEAGTSKANHLAQEPDWQPAGKEFAHDYWPAFNGDAKPFKDEKGNEVVTYGGQADGLKGYPQDFFTGAIVWKTWPALMGGATPTEPLPLKVVNEETGRSTYLYRPEDGSLAIQNDYGFSRGTRYKIENLPQYLDTGGEFYLDTNQAKEILFFRPEEGVNPNDMHLELAINEGNIVIEDQSFIEISGLGFRYCDGTAVEFIGNCESLSVHHCVFRDLMKYAIGNSFRRDYGSEPEPGDKAESELEWMNQIVIADNELYNIWDQSILFRSPPPRNRMRRQSGPQQLGRLGHFEILRNKLEDVGIRHQGSQYSAIPAISLRGAETATIAGNIVKRSLGSGIMVFGGATGGLRDSEWPLSRILVYHNATEATARGVNDYGGVSLWQSGVIYTYNNNIGNSLGHMPGGIFGSGRPLNLSYPYYIDGGFKIVGFNNIIWGNSVDPDDPYRSMTAGNFSVFGFLNHFTNNTIMRQGRALGGSSGERTDIISNVFAEISLQFLRNNRVENPSLVGGGDTGASGIRGIPSLAYGRNFFHGPAEAGTLLSRSGSYGVEVHQEISAETIEEMARQMQSYPVRYGQLGQYLEESPLVGELRPDGLREEGATAADFRLREGSPAIDHGATYFYPWSLAGNVGEWHFTENHADPEKVVDYSYYMSEAHINRFMYSWIPIYSLQLNSTTLEDYVEAPSEDWVKGALSFDGSRFGTVKDKPMREDIEMPITEFIRGRGQRTWRLWNRLDKELWSIPEPEGGYDSEGNPLFGKDQIMSYPAERRNTLISKDGNLLVEVKFRTDPGHTGGYLLSKHDGKSGYALYIDDAGRVQFEISASGSHHSVMTQAVVNDGDWHHVLAEIDRETGRMTIYHNGKAAGEIMSGLSPGSSIDNNADFFVGKSGAGDEGFLVGAVDFMRVCHGTLEDARTSIGELYAWQYTDGPHLFDMRGWTLKGKRRDAGALELQ